MSKKGLPSGLAMRHGRHYVEELSKPSKTIGKMISIEAIVPNPEQPRIDVGDLTELSESIAQKGILEPLLVKRLVEQDVYMIIAGERRWRSAKLAGLNEVPCIELEIDEQEVAEIALIENMQRKDLTVWEEADGILALQTKYGYTHADIAKKIGKSRTSVTESLNIASLSNEVRNKIKECGNDSKQFILQVARQFDEQSMLEFLSKHSSAKQASVQILEPSTPMDRTNDVASVGAENVKSPNPQNIELSNGSFNIDRPSKLFHFSDNESGFNLKIKFKTAADKERLTQSLRDLLRKIEGY